MTGVLTRVAAGVPEEAHLPESSPPAPIQRLFPAVVLLKAAALIENIGRVVGFDEEIPQNVDPLAIVAGYARLLGRLFQGLSVHWFGYRG